MRGALALSSSSFLLLLSGSSKAAGSVVAESLEKIDEKSIQNSNDHNNFFSFLLDFHTNANIILHLGLQLPLQGCPFFFFKGYRP